MIQLHTGDIEIRNHTFSYRSFEAHRVYYNKNSVSDFSVGNITEKWNYIEKQTKRTGSAARINQQAAGSAYN